MPSRAAGTKPPGAIECRGVVVMILLRDFGVARCNEIIRIDFNSRSTFVEVFMLVEIKVFIIVEVEFFSNNLKRKLKIAVELPSELIIQILSWLPSKSLLRSEHQYLHLRFGFGYHKMSDDYKVIRVAYVRGGGSIVTPHVQIYTVKTAIWREVVFPNDLPFFIFSNYSQVFLNGSIHWVVIDRSILRCSILTFDMSTEFFGEIEFPKSLGDQDPRGIKLAVVDDSLAMIYSTRSSKPWWSSSSYKIWTMKDYKNPISWTMIYKVCYPENDVGRALGLTNNGDLITVESTEGDVMICNQEGWNSVYDSCSDIDSEYTFVERYQESLALLDDGEVDDEV
ncbi:hypothetical protein L2E82_29811 [Cichorium intybus]|uniref:Uncharacterized protein n=1 Tax=Cichorium intybus TaxID=13427 RepID=A0ACB9CZA1_CICIN|nr:hypothetical protein L2E82_29811 [Cichorium intybus]